MHRRQFMGRCAAVGGALLGRDVLAFSRQNLGVGADYAAERKPRLPRATGVDGRVTAVDGTSVAVDLTAREAATTGRIRVVRRTYPTGERVNAAVSERVGALDAGESKTVRVEVPRNGRTPGAWFYEVQAASSTDDATPEFLCESRPYQWPKSTGAAVTPADRVTDGHDAVRGEWFERRLDDNEYALAYRWEDADGDTWRVDFRIRRSTHEAAVAGERGYVKTYEEALASPVVRALAAALETDARREVDARAGETNSPTSLSSLDDGRRFGHLVRFVQYMEYARDAASMGTYDYNRTPTETLVADVGDCKDLTHLLAGLLSASFDCETALLFQPGHVLLGVAPGDVPELPYDVDTVTLGGRELVTIDPSLHVPVGYHPDDPFVAAYGDGEWFHHDASAIGRGVDDVVRDWLEKTDVLPKLR